MLPADVTPLVLSGNPEQTRDRYGVETCDRQAFLPVLQALRQSDVLIWRQLNARCHERCQPILLWGLMALAQQVKLKTIRAGIGPLKRPLTRWLARRTFANCTGVSVRDRGSAALLSDWQVSCIPAPDPVWALDATSVPGLWICRLPEWLTLRSHPQLTATRLANFTRSD